MRKRFLDPHLDVYYRQHIRTKCISDHHKGNRTLRDYKQPKLPRLILRSQHWRYIFVNVPLSELRMEGSCVNKQCYVFSMCSRCFLRHDCSFVLRTNFQTTTGTAKSSLSTRVGKVWVVVLNFHGSKGANVSIM